MICLMCKKAEPLPGLTRVTFERGEFSLVVKNVPALICPGIGSAGFSPAYLMVVQRGDEERYQLLRKLFQSQRVEVVRGPGSSLYGNGALTAVINIVTVGGAGFGPLSPFGCFSGFVFSSAIVSLLAFGRLLLVPGDAWLATSRPRASRGDPSPWPRARARSSRAARACLPRRPP